MASYSNTGADVYAPGGDASGQCQSYTNCILSTWKNGGYALDQGTSMATPHVAGLTALLLSEGYSNAQAIARINSTADSVNGIRRINAMRAVGATSQPSGPSPTPTPTRRRSSGPRVPSTSTPSVKPSTAKTVTAPSATPSSSVLAVTPTISPSPSAQAAGPSESTAAHSRATQLTLAALAIVVVALATARLAVRRRRV